MLFLILAFFCLNLLDYDYLVSLINFVNALCKEEEDEQVRGMIAPSHF